MFVCSRSIVILVKIHYRGKGWLIFEITGDDDSDDSELFLRIDLPPKLHLALVFNWHYCQILLLLRHSDIRTCVEPTI